MMKNKFLESLGRKVDSGDRLVGVVDHGLSLNESWFDESRLREGNRFVVIVDARESGAVSSLVPIVLEKLVSLARIRGRWRLKRVATALAYVSASIVTRAAGVDFRYVQSGMRYADELVKPGVESEANRRLEDALGKIEHQVLFVMQNVLSRDAGVVEELILAARHVSSLSDGICFLFVLDSLRLGGDNADVLFPSGVARFDSVIHLPRLQQSSRLDVWLGNGGAAADLSDSERRSVENFFLKVSRVPNYSARSLRLALGHLMSSREVWSRESEFFGVVPFLVGLKYHDASLYSRFVERSMGRDELAELYPDSDPYIRLLESELRGNYKRSLDDESTAVIRRMILSLEKRGF